MSAKISPLFHIIFTQKDLFRLESQIPLAGVHGRIDHLAYDAGGHRLFVAALGNNSVEIVDLAKNTRLQSIAGLDEPQGVLYNCLFVGYRHPAEVKALDCRTGAVLATLSCVGDADDMFYDEADSLLLVTGGDGYIDIFRNDKLIRLACDFIY